MYDVLHAFETIRRLNYPRECGSPGEARAQELLADELRAIGLEPLFHTFEDWWVEPADARLSIGDIEIAIQPATSLAFLAGCSWMDGRGREVQVSGILTREQPATRGFIAIREECDIAQAVTPGASGQVLLFDHTPEFEPYLWATDFIPSAYVTGEGRQVVLDSVGQTGTLRWRSAPCRREFRNLMVDVPGTSRPDELVVMGAHLDSFPGTVGSADDAAGCAVLLEAARHFSAHRPDRTVRMVWFTREELDQHGSARFAEDYDISPESVRLFVNVDGGFEIETGEALIYASTEQLGRWAEMAIGHRGLPIHIGAGGSSDSKAFADRAIPVFHACGRSRQPAHLPTDCPETIDMAKLELLGGLAIQAASLAGQISFVL
jgi:hypothetical protein